MSMLIMPKKTMLTITVEFVLLSLDPKLQLCQGQTAQKYPPFTSPASVILWPSTEIHEYG